MIEGMVDLAGGDEIAAIDKLRAAISMSDSWLIRFQLGQAYLGAGYAAEALDEFNICQSRQGEATSIFLDDQPTWRYTADLPYWMGRAQEALGMKDAAFRNYESFLATRASGPLADDARGRL
jgi:tetratricopeptide (TPR) repeat protein